MSLLTYEAAAGTTSRLEVGHELLSWNKTIWWFLEDERYTFGEVYQRTPLHLSSKLLPELHKGTGLDLTPFVRRRRTCTKTYTKDGKMDLLGQENRYRQFINLSNKLIILKISYLIKRVIPANLFIPNKKSPSSEFPQVVDQLN